MRLQIEFLNYHLTIVYHPRNRIEDTKQYSGIVKTFYLDAQLKVYIKFSRMLKIKEPPVTGDINS